MPRGRPTVYRKDVADDICVRLSQGESLRSICKTEDYPDESTVRLWAVDDWEGFTAKYLRARDIGLDVRADEVLDIADEGTGDPVRDRLRFDARRWYLSKMAPKRYGDRLAQELSGPNGAPIAVAASININPVRARDD